VTSSSSCPVFILFVQHIRRVPYALHSARCWPLSMPSTVYGGSRLKVKVTADKVTLCSNIDTGNVASDNQTTVFKLC